MKRINTMVTDAAKAELVRYQIDHGHPTLDEAIDAHLLEFKRMWTYKGKWIKTHVGCGGLIRYTENMDPGTPQTFDMECSKCGKMVCEEEIEFERR